jgi:hypothetical protein
MNVVNITGSDAAPDEIIETAINCELPAKMNIDIIAISTGCNPAF